MTSTSPLRGTAVAPARDCAGMCWLKTKILDSRLPPVLRWLLAGVSLLSWIIQPRPDDSVFAIMLLMFLRFVPVFVLIGSRVGRAGAGAMIGIALLFALMAAGSLSFITWDARVLDSATHVARQAVNVSNLLYLLAALSLGLCLAVIFRFNRSTSQPGGQQARGLLQIMMAVQIVLLVELVYLGCRNGWMDEAPRPIGKTSKPAARQPR